MTGNNAKADVIDFANKLKLASKALKDLERHSVHWDLRNSPKAISEFSERLKTLSELGALVLHNCEKQLAKNDMDFGNAEYHLDLEKNLKASGVPIQGDFPEYTFPPFRLVIDTSQRLALLRTGRKSVTTTALHPVALSSWVAKHYQAVTSGKFDKLRFSKELIAAYRYASKIVSGQPQVRYGIPVKLKLIYDILTVRRESRSVYPLELFTFELGRLSENYELTCEEFRLELGFTKSAADALLVTSSKGKERRYGSLTVHTAHKEEGSDGSSK